MARPSADKSPPSRSDAEAAKERTTQLLREIRRIEIQTSRLEAEARKETTVKNAEAMAQSKVIDSRAELERGKLMAESEAAGDHEISLPRRFR